jgi:hypothetical protein
MLLSRYRLYPRLRDDERQRLLQDLDHPVTSWRPRVQQLQALFRRLLPPQMTLLTRLNRESVDEVTARRLVLLYGLERVLRATEQPGFNPAQPPLAMRAVRRLSARRIGAWPLPPTYQAPAWKVTLRQLQEQVAPGALTKALDMPVELQPLPTVAEVPGAAPGTFFYVLQPDPEATPNEIEFGLTSRLARRLQRRQDDAPLACFFAAWPAPRHLAAAAVQRLVAAVDCCLLRDGVYDCPDLAQLRAAGDEFFAGFTT